MSHVRKCLKCSKLLPGQTAADGSGAVPKAGDVAICFECGEVMIFEGVGFRYPTPEEFSELFADQAFASTIAAVAIRLSGAKDPAAVIVNDKGVATVLAEEAATICENCGKLRECRPYGLRKADGSRMRVCFDCADLNPAETERAFDERIEGR